MMLRHHTRRERLYSWATPNQYDEARIERARLKRERKGWVKQEWY